VFWVTIGERPLLLLHKRDFKLRVRQAKWEREAVGKRAFQVEKGRACLEKDAEPGVAGA
jgi:hypothetical protein